LIMLHFLCASAQCYLPEADQQKSVDMKKFTGIYRINLGNGLFYIGSSDDIQRRERQHISTLKYQTHRNKRMQRNWNKYQVFEFEVLELCSENDLLTKEQALLDVYFGTSKCANLVSIAGRTTGYKHTKATKKMLSRPRSEATRKKLSEAMKTSLPAINHLKQLHETQIGRHPSKETREKMSRSGMGVPHSAETRAKLKIHLTQLNKSRIGMPQSAEQIRKSAAGRTGSRRSDATKAKMSIARAMWWAKKRDEAA